jgi:hypothetical protein
VDASGSDDKSKIFNSVCMEGTLRDFGTKVSFMQALEDAPNMVVMLLGGVGEDEDIIKIHDDEEVDHVLEQVVHEVLELHGGISRAHWHDKPLVGTVLHAKGCKPFVTLSDSNVVVAIMKVDFSVNCGMTKVIEELVDEGERIVALFCNLIECTIVDTQAKTAIFLLHE